MQYLYSDGDLYYFMDNESYEQIPINKSILGDNFAFVKENMEVKVLSYKEMYLVLSLQTLLSLRLLQLIRALREIQLQILQNLQQLKQVLK